MLMIKPRSLREKEKRIPLQKCYLWAECKRKGIIRYRHEVKIKLGKISIKSI